MDGDHKETWKTFLQEASNLSSSHLLFRLQSYFIVIYVVHMSCSQDLLGFDRERL